MDKDNIEYLKLLKRNVKQLNKQLLWRHILLSLGISSILTIIIDFYWDLRFIYFLIWIALIAYLAYKIIFEFKFSKLKDIEIQPQSEIDELKKEIEYDYFTLGSDKIKLAVYYKDSIYNLTENFIWIYQGFKLLGIAQIDKSNTKEEISVFLSKFKNQRDLKKITLLSTFIIFLILTLKITIININQQFFKNEFTYKVESIVTNDSILYDSISPVYVILTTNFLQDVYPQNEVVKFHCRKEFSNNIRLLYTTGINISLKKIQKDFEVELLGLYKLYNGNQEIILTNDSTVIRIAKIKKNQHTIE